MPQTARRKTAAKPSPAATRAKRSTRGRRRLTPVERLLADAGKSRRRTETDRLKRFAREYMALQQRVHELLAEAATRRLESEERRLLAAIEDEAARRRALESLFGRSSGS